MNRRIYTTITVIALGAAVVLAAAGYFLRQNHEPTWADAGDADLVARGRIVYQQNCAACHGARLEGQANWRTPKADGTLPAPPHDVTGHTWHHSDQMLFDVTKYGSASVAGPGFKSGMPLYADILDDGDIWAVLAYIKSHWPADIQAAQSARSGDTRR
jgi:mono/diheme cytochrome c family protein